MDHFDPSRCYRSSVNGGHGPAVGTERDKYLQSRRPDRDAVDDSCRETAWPQKDVPHLFPRVRRCADGGVRTRSRTADAALYVFPDRIDDVRYFWGVHFLSA